MLKLLNIITSKLTKHMTSHMTFPLFLNKCKCPSRPNKCIDNIKYSGVLQLFYMILRIFIVQPRFHVVGARAWKKRPLAAKLARFESGNSNILDQGNQTKSLSYVASFYSKSFAKLLNNHIFGDCLLTIYSIRQKQNQKQGLSWSVFKNWLHVLNRNMDQCKHKHSWVWGYYFWRGYYFWSG